MNRISGAQAHRVTREENKTIYGKGSRDTFNPCSENDDGILISFSLVINKQTFRKPETFHTY